jgi:SAM-dependent methyltransferase
MAPHHMMSDPQPRDVTAIADRDGKELAAVMARYAKRRDDQQRYSLLTPAVLLAMQERQRAIANLLVGIGWLDLEKLRLVEVGCGTGGNLLEFLRLGFRPEHLQGIELIAAYADTARNVLPTALQITCGDAAVASASSVTASSQDIVCQFTVFSSILDNALQQRLADTMWRWLRPGGGVLWYDFTMNNPRNPDVRGVTVKRIGQLFPEATIKVTRLTLAPPIARAVAPIHPALYGVLSTCVWLRTHVLAWIEKPE